MIYASIVKQRRLTPNKSFTGENTIVLRIVVLLYFLTSLSESAGNDDIAETDTPRCPLEPVVYVRLCQCHQVFAGFSIKRSVHN